MAKQTPKADPVQVPVPGTRTRQKPKNPAVVAMRQGRPRQKSGLSDGARAAMRQHKADLVARGLCRQCGERRGRSPSVSRCRRCYLLARETSRAASGSKPWHPGKHGGRAPLDAREQMKRLRQLQRGQLREAEEALRQPLPRR